MWNLAVSFLLLVLGVLAGVYVTKLCLQDNSKRLDVLGLSVGGLLIGFLIGMSDSPIISAVMTGTLTLAGLVFGKLWDQSSKRTEVKTESRTETGTSSETVTKSEAGGGSIPLDWLPAFCIPILIGALLGAAVRINEVLSLRDRSIPARLVQLGFEEAQVKRIMDRWADKVDLKQLGESWPATGFGFQSGSEQPTGKELPRAEPNSDFDWPAEWKRKNDAKVNFDDPKVATGILETYLQESNVNPIPDSIRNVIKRKRANLPDHDVEILKQLKTFTE